MWYITYTLTLVMVKVKGVLKIIMGKVITNRLGEENYNQHHTLMKIINYRSASDIDVEFQDEHKYVVKKMRYDYFKDGRLQNPFDKTVLGVGYLGKNYITKEDSKAYCTWHGMLERCYDSTYQQKKPTYKGCFVCNEWLNYSVFKQWYDNNFYVIKNDQLHLDKDILKKKNKCYCPEHCILVPRRINSLFTNGTNVRGQLPVGVTLDRTTYRARLSTLEKGRIDLGHYKNIEEAFNAYKIAKESYIKQVAEEYKSQIPKRLYEAMYNWIVEIDD